MFSVQVVDVAEEFEPALVDLILDYYEGQSYLEFHVNRFDDSGLRPITDWLLSRGVASGPMVLLYMATDE